MQIVSLVGVALCSLAPVAVVTAMSVPREHVAIAQAASSTQESHGMSLEQAVAMVQAKYHAKVIRANTVEEDGRTVHYIRLMSADRSRVWTVRVDAATGREF